MGCSWLRTVGLVLCALLVGDHTLRVEAKVRSGSVHRAFEGITSHLGPLLTAHAATGEKGAALVGFHDNVPYSPVNVLSVRGPDGAMLDTMFEGSLSPTWDGDSQLDILVSMAHQAQWEWLDKKAEEARLSLEAAQAHAARMRDNVRESVSDGWDSVVSSTRDTYENAMNSLQGHLTAVSEVGVRQLKALKAAVYRLRDSFTGINHGPNDVSGLEVIGAVIFGFINGFLEGLGDMLRETMRHPSCRENTVRVQQQFSVTADSVINALLGLFDAEVRDGKSRREMFRIAVDDLVQLMKDLWTLISECKPLLMVLGMILLIVVVATVIILLLAATVVGLLIKIAAIVVSIVQGISFVWNTLKDMAGHIAACTVARQSTADGVCPKAAVIGIIEGVAALAGWVVQVIVLSGLNKIVSVSNIKAALQSRTLKSLKIRWHPEMAADFRRFATQMEGLKDGTRVNFEIFKSRVSSSLARIKAGATGDSAGAASVRANVARQADNADELNGAITNRIGQRNVNRLTEILKARHVLASAAQDALVKAQGRLDDVIKQFPNGKPPAGSRAERELLRLTREVDAAKVRAATTADDAASAEAMLMSYKWETPDMERVIARNMGDKADATMGKAHKLFLRHREIIERFRKHSAEYLKKAEAAADKMDELIALMSSTSRNSVDKAKIDAALDAYRAAARTMDAAQASRAAALDDVMRMYTKEADALGPYVRQMLDTQAAKVGMDADNVLAGINQRFTDLGTRLDAMIEINMVSDLPVSKLATQAIRDAMPQMQQIKVQVADVATESLKRSNHWAEVYKTANTRFRALLDTGADAITSNRNSLFRTLHGVAEVAADGKDVAEQFVDASHYTHRITVRFERAWLRPDAERTSKWDARDRVVAFVSVVFDGAIARSTLRPVDRDVEVGGVGESEQEGGVAPPIGQVDMVLDDTIEIYTNHPDHTIRFLGTVANERQFNRTASTRAVETSASAQEDELLVYGMNDFEVPAVSQNPTRDLENTGKNAEVYMLYPVVETNGETTFRRSGAAANPAGTGTPSSGEAQLTTIVAGEDDSTVPESLAFGAITATVVTEQLRDAAEAAKVVNAGTNQPTRVVVVRRNAVATDEGRDRISEIERSIGALAAEDGTPVLGAEEERCTPGLPRIPWDLSDTMTRAVRAKLAGPEAGPSNMLGVNCVEYQLVSIAELERPTSHSTRGSSNEATFKGNEENIWLQCRPATTPARTAASRLCFTDFSHTMCTVNSGLKYNGGTFTFAEQAGRDKSDISVGPRFLACGQRLGLQCDIRWRHGSLGSFRMSPIDAVNTHELENKVKLLREQALEARRRGASTVLGPDPRTGKILDEALRGLDYELREYSITAVTRDESRPWPTMQYLFGRSTMGKVRFRVTRKSSALTRWVRALAGEQVTTSSRAILMYLDAKDEEKSYRKVMDEVRSWGQPGGMSAQPRVNTFKDHGTCPMVFAHRGVEGKGGVENSLMSLSNSAMRGLDGSEVDVYLAGSEKVGWEATTLHDKNLDRLTGYSLDVTGWGEHQHATYDRIKKSLAQCYLFPSLAETLQVAKLLGMQLDVELKPESPLEKMVPGYTKMIGKEVGRLIRRYEMTDNVVVSGFDPLKLAEINQKHETEVIQTALAVHGVFGSHLINAVNAVAGLDDRESKSRMYQIGLFNGRKTRRVHRKGGYVGTYTFADLLIDRHSRKGKKFYSLDTVKETVRDKIDWIETDDVEMLYTIMGLADCTPRHSRKDISGDRHMLVEKISPSVDPVEMFNRDYDYHDPDFMLKFERENKIRRDNDMPVQKHPDEFNNVALGIDGEVEIGRVEK